MERTEEASHMDSLDHGGFKKERLCKVEMKGGRVEGSELEWTANYTFTQIVFHV